MEAKPHPRQQDRLNALYSYEILDSEREAEFDDIVMLTAKICGTPICVINLIDESRQWFKAEVGLGLRETPLATSICSHIILEEEFVEINDTLTDPRMADNPLVCSDPGLRFYAGALLKTDGGLPIGTLCVLDWKPGSLTPLQRDCIRVMSRQVMAQLDLRRSLRMAEVLRQEVDHRVKNSLQMISAFAGLECRRLRHSPEAASALNDMQRRIQSVSILHEQLYRAGAGDRIDLAAYLVNLGEHLQAVAPMNVRVEVDADPIIIPSSRAAQIGTLVNELAANSFKHAFPQDAPGCVSISLRALGEGRFRLDCRDDGVGFAAPANGATTGLGMRIIETVSGQLGGAIEFAETPTGTAASITVDLSA